MNADALSKTQILELLGAAHARNRVHWLLLLVTYLHGLRASEVVHIKAEDVRDGYLTVVREKGSEVTIQPLLESPNPLLNERPAMIERALNTPGFRPLFNVTRQTVFNYVRRYGRAANLPAHQCHPHILKHSCGTHMYEKCKNLALVQKWLGHVSGASTMIYLNSSQQQVTAAAQDALTL